MPEELAFTTVDVTRSHIDRSARRGRDCDNCPIAIAFEDMGLDEIHVGQATLWTGYLGNIHETPLPAEAATFSQRHCDDYEAWPPTPIRFQVDLRPLGIANR